MAGEPGSLGDPDEWITHSSGLRYRLDGDEVVLRLRPFRGVFYVNGVTLTYTDAPGRRYVSAWAQWGHAERPDDTSPLT